MTQTKRAFQVGERVSVSGFVVIEETAEMRFLIAGWAGTIKDTSKSKHEVQLDNSVLVFVHPVQLRRLKPKTRKEYWVKTCLHCQNEVYDAAMNVKASCDLCKIALMREVRPTKGKK